LNVAQAEWYVGGFGGLSLPGTLSDVTVTKNFGRFGATAAARSSDTALENNLVLGAKAGYFFEAHKWFGVETEVFTFTPNLTQQPLIVAQPGKAAFGFTVPGSHIRVTALALNAITRDTASERFVPYGGVGMGVFYVDSNDFKGKPVLNPGLNLIGGARYFLFDHVALFGEFRYNVVTLRFGGFSGNFTGQMFSIGISYHFR
jgi:opacity protein-like surface antigen